MKHHELTTIQQAKLIRDGWQPSEGDKGMCFVNSFGVHQVEIGTYGPYVYNIIKSRFDPEPGRNLQNSLDENLEYIKDAIRYRTECLNQTVERE